MLNFKFTLRRADKMTSTHKNLADNYIKLSSAIVELAALESGSGTSPSNPNGDTPGDTNGGAAAEPSQPPPNAGTYRAFLLPFAGGSLERQLLLFFFFQPFSSARASNIDKR